MIWRCVAGAALRFSRLRYTVQPCHLVYSTLDCAASCNPFFVIHSDVKSYFLSLPLKVDRFKQVICRYFPNDAINYMPIWYWQQLFLFMGQCSETCMWPFQSLISCVYSISMSMIILDFVSNKHTFFWILCNCNKINPWNSYLYSWFGSFLSSSLSLSFLANARTQTFDYASVVNIRIWHKQYTRKQLTYYAFTKNIFQITL